MTLIVTYGYVFALQTRVGWDTIAANSIKQDPKAVERLANSSAEQQAQVQKITVASIQYGMYAGTVLDPGVFARDDRTRVCGAPSIFSLAAQATFGQVFAAVDVRTACRC